MSSSDTASIENNPPVAGPTFDPQSVVSKKVRQKTSSENWLRRALIFLLVIWMLVAVVFPVYQLIDRSMHAEVLVSIWGSEDIRIAGRRVFIDEETLRLNIDKQSFPLTNTITEWDGVTVDVRDDVIYRVTCTKAMVYAEPVEIKAVTATVDGDRFFINGVELLEDEYSTQVRRWIGLSNFISYFGNRALYYSVYNSIFVSVVTTIVAVLLALVYAYAVTRTLIPGKAFFRVVAMLPLYAPTMLYGLSLVFIFGNKGFITTGFFGHLPWLAWDIGLYGPVGIIIAEVVFTFPAAYMILMVTLLNTDARLYEAAISLGASRTRIFFTVTLPGIKFGLVSAIFVCFTLCFTDFGAPKVVGGNYNILAVDIYKQVIGQQNFGMGATISIILLIPAIISFIADRIVQRRQVIAMTARSVPFSPKRKWGLDTVMFTVASLISGFILSMLFAGGFGSLVKMWPYDFSLGFWHYTFADVGGGGYGAFWNSVRMATYSAILGTMVTFGSAYLIEKTRKVPLLRQVSYFLSIIPLALPGLVIGIAYIFFFNTTHFTIPLTNISFANPAHALYGTLWILIIANIIHFYTVSFLTATSALRQLDKEFETVSESMSVPFYRTFFRVTVPVCFPAIVEIAMYLFVSSMATVSAVIFLYSSDTTLASVAVVNMDDAGDQAPAAAMCMLIVITNILVRVASEVVNAVFRKATSAWRTR
jgi:iron(III) transport system permease protein